MTYHVRGRAHASGSVAGNTFISEGINRATDLSNGVLIYSINGSDVADADLLAAAALALTANGDDAPGFRIDVRRGSGGGTIFTAEVELICVTKSP